MTSPSATSSALVRLRSALLAGVAVAAISAFAPVVATSVVPSATATSLDPVQDQDLLTPSGSLGTTLSDPAKRATVVDQLTAAADSTAEQQGGLVARAYAAVDNSAPDATRTLLDRQLVGYANALQPQWDAYQAAGASGGFGSYLAARAPEVSTALVGVSDRFAAAAETSGARLAYSLARSSAQDNISAALPQIGTVVENAMR